MKLLAVTTRRRCFVLEFRWDWIFVTANSIDFVMYGFGIKKSHKFHAIEKVRNTSRELSRINYSFSSSFAPSLSNFSNEMIYEVFLPLDFRFIFARKTLAWVSRESNSMFAQGLGDPFQVHLNFFFAFLSHRNTKNGSTDVKRRKRLRKSSTWTVTIHTKG